VPKILFKEFIFDHSYSFIYSPRPGTTAFTMVDFTSKEVKKKRLSLIQKKVSYNVDYINNSMLNTIQRVIINGFLFRSSNILFGYTDNNRLVCVERLNLNIGETILVKVLFYRNSIFYSDFYM
jgi:tRNA-2-methylthio-N6-dimethylallyladenosine synthase